MENNRVNPEVFITSAITYLLEIEDFTEFKRVIDSEYLNPHIGIDNDISFILLIVEGKTLLDLIKEKRGLDSEHYKLINAISIFPTRARVIEQKNDTEFQQFLETLNKQPYSIEYLLKLKFNGKYLHEKVIDRTNSFTYADLSVQVRNSMNIIKLKKGIKRLGNIYKHLKDYKDFFKLELNNIDGTAYIPDYNPLKYCVIHEKVDAFNFLVQSIENDFFNFKKELLIQYIEELHGIQESTRREMKRIVDTKPPPYTPKKINELVNKTTIINIADIVGKMNKVSREKKSKNNKKNKNNKRNKKIKKSKKIKRSKRSKKIMRRKKKITNSSKK